MRLINLKNYLCAIMVLGSFVVSVSFGKTTKAGMNSEDTIPSFYKSYENTFYIGTAFSTSHFSDSAYMAIVKKHFNSITAENAMKWEKIHPKPGVYYFDRVDSLMDFAEKNNMYVVGHVLVWHSQTPDWVFEDASGKLVSSDTLLARMRDHIFTVVGRYKGRVKSWDVVNEAVESNGMRNSKWYRIIGEDYVVKAFQYAYEADSSALLIYNDFSLPTAEKRNATVNLVKKLQAKGIQIGGIGMQGHYHLDYPFLYELDSSIAAFSALGVKVMITELDVNMLPFPLKDFGADVGMRAEMKEELDPYKNGLPDSMQVILTNRYADFFKIFLKYKTSVQRVTFWGINDGQSWLNYWPVPGRTNYPLVFDRQYQPKPVFWKLVEIGNENK